MKRILAMLLLLTTTIGISGQSCKDYITNEWPNSRYTIETISGNNVVTDNSTGLMWQQCSEGLRGADCTIGTSETYTWSVVVGNIGRFAGYTDWRIPNKKELRTLVAKNCYRPSINSSVFPNTPLNFFWTSSPAAHFDSGAWLVSFNYGYDFLVDRFNIAHIRLVRSIGQ